MQLAIYEIRNRISNFLIKRRRVDPTAPIKHLSSDL